MIETKRFLLPNIKNDNQIKENFVRIQKHECSNYYGEEIKDPVYKNNIHFIEKPEVHRSFTTKKIPKISRNPNIKPLVKLDSVKPVKLFDYSSKKESNVSKTHRNFCKTKRFLSVQNIGFPYCKPRVNNSYSKIMLRQAKKERYLLNLLKNLNRRKIKS